MPAQLPPLPYPYEALEPFISKEIMTLHHTKHHQTYVNALNAAEEAYAKASSPKERIALQSALKFNGGGECILLLLAPSFSRDDILTNSRLSGHINHSLFWKNLAPSPRQGGRGGEFPSGSKLLEAINVDFGSFDNFKKQFSTATLSIQGSGWGWLVRFFPSFHEDPHSKSG